MRGIGNPILIGRPEVIEEQIKNLGLTSMPRSWIPAISKNSRRMPRPIYDLRQRKGMTLADRARRVREPTCSVR